MEREKAIAMYNLALAGVNLRKEYTKKYPTDKLANEINPSCTLADVFTAINDEKDEDGEAVYEVMGVGDSLVRECVFEMISEITNLPYDFIYYVWLGYPEEARKALRKNSSQN